MSVSVVQGSELLAKAIRGRRLELDLTVEVAAATAGVGSKSWSRYESGGSIRKDKVRGICKALRWRNLPAEELVDALLEAENYREHEAWSQPLYDTYGVRAAISFAVGSDILLDYICDDLQALATKPKGSHIGEIDCSLLSCILPEQFLVHYDYEFLFAMRIKIQHMRIIAHHGHTLIARSVLEELILYLIVEESRDILDNIDIAEDDDWDDWMFQLFDDMDIVTFLYNDRYLANGDTYHFDHWMDQQFYCDR